jgi:hypothetical protein
VQVTEAQPQQFTSAHGCLQCNDQQRLKHRASSTDGGRSIEQSALLVCSQHPITARRGSRLPDISNWVAATDAPLSTGMTEDGGQGSQVPNHGAGATGLQTAVSVVGNNLRGHVADCIPGHRIALQCLEANGFFLGTTLSRRDRLPVSTDQVSQEQAVCRLGALVAMTVHRRLDRASPPLSFCLGAKGLDLCREPFAADPHLVGGAALSD